MKSIKLVLLMVFLLGATITFNSCRKKEREESYQSAEDDAQMNDEFSSIGDFMDDEAKNTDGIKKAGSLYSTLPTCAVVTRDTVTRTIIVDFGSTNCQCKDGVYRRGKIKGVFTGKYRTMGSTAVITLDNFFANDIQFTGTKTLTNLGNSSGNFKYRKEVTGASAITPSGTISWTSIQEIERVEGDTTLNPFDDVYMITGTTSGTNRKGEKYSMTTTQALKKKISCRNIVSGKVSITNSKGNDLDLNFDPIGKEDCDNIAEVTFRGKTKRIALR